MKASERLQQEIKKKDILSVIDFCYQTIDKGREKLREIEKLRDVESEKDT